MVSVRAPEREGADRSPADVASSPSTMKRPQQRASTPPPRPPNAAASTPRTRLSDLLPTNEAVRILGEDTVRLVVRAFLRCCRPPPSSSSPSEGGRRPGPSTPRVRYNHPLDPRESRAERSEVGVLMRGLAFNFSHGGGCDDAKIDGSNGEGEGEGEGEAADGIDRAEAARTAARAWARLSLRPVPGYESCFEKGGGYGFGVDGDSLDRGERPAGVGGKPPPHPARGGGRGRASAVPLPPDGSGGESAATASRMTGGAIPPGPLYVLGLDKPSYLRRGMLFPPTAVPDRGPHGHMALMDCVFNALSSTAPPDRPASTAVNGGGGNRGDRESPSPGMNHRAGGGGGSASGADRASRTGEMSRGGRGSADAVVGGGADRGTIPGGGRPRILLPDLLIAFAICRLAEVEMERRGRREEERIEKERRHILMAQHLTELDAGATRRAAVGVGEGEGEGEGEFGDGDEAGEASKECAGEDAGAQRGQGPTPSASPPPPPPPLHRDDGLRLASLLIFRVYDGYQRHNTLTRDTLQRFLSDVHGEESYKAPAVRSCLDEVFRYVSSGDAASPLPPQPHHRHLSPPHQVLSFVDPNAFEKGIERTVVYLPGSSPASCGNTGGDGTEEEGVGGGANSIPSIVASHVFLDWILVLFNCMLPRTFPPPRIAAEHYLRIANSDPARMIDALSTKYGLCECGERGPAGGGGGADGRGGARETADDVVLYEIRRRFHSLQNSGEGVADLDSDPTATDSSSPEASGGALEKGKSEASDGGSSSSPEDGGGAEGEGAEKRGETEGGSDEGRIPLDEGESLNQEGAADSSDDAAGAILSVEGGSPAVDADAGEGADGEECRSAPVRRLRNVVYERGFIAAVSQPSDELGHGGYLPAELARWTFRANSGRAEVATSRLGGKDLWGDGAADVGGWSGGGDVEEMTTEAGGGVGGVVSVGGGGEIYWTMYDTISFGCDAVRWEALEEFPSDESEFADAAELLRDEDNRRKYGPDVPLLRFAFRTFRQLPRQDGKRPGLSGDSDDASEVVLPRSGGSTTDGEDAHPVLTRSQIGKMILLLLEHASFRLEADSPPSFCGDAVTAKSRNPLSKKPDRGEEEGVELLDDDDYLHNLQKTSDGTDYLLATLVDASYASLLGLLPPNLDLSTFSNPTSSSAPSSQAEGSSSVSPRLVSLSVLVDYVLSQSCISVDKTGKVGSADDGDEGPSMGVNVLDFRGFVKWHLRLSTSETNRAIPVSQTRLGPFMLDLRLIASVLFGVRPACPSTELVLVREMQRRHKYRYPRTRDRSTQPRGPSGTVWSVINADWFRAWRIFAEGNEVHDDDAAAGGWGLGKIDNNMLLSEEGILSLKQGLQWKRDFELLEPLAWSALQAWHDGGPPISRTVVPFNPQKSDQQNRISYSPGREGVDNNDGFEVELYPLYATVFLCDAASRGEPRPFQQFVPLSRYLPLRELIDKLLEGLGRDGAKPKNCRLWMMSSAGASSVARATASPSKAANDTIGWPLHLDMPITDERNSRGSEVGSDENVSIMLEMRNEKDGVWPRTNMGKNALRRCNSSESNKSMQHEEVDLGDGVVGLYNMGNTCYLNSSIQCMSHTPILKDYFTSKSYLRDINTTNPLGHQGRLAQVFAVLVNNLWKKFEDGSSSSKKNIGTVGSSTPLNVPSLTPKSFREAIGKFNEHFAGNEQHDAQELLAFLLSGLSEDLNRIMDKPYIEAPDSDGRPDEELADIWWSNHLKRELSIIEALFTGQYKSLLTCRTCKYESARFEPFAFLQLPLPEDDQISVQCIVYPMAKEKEIMKYSVCVRHDGAVTDVLMRLARTLHTDERGDAPTEKTNGARNETAADSGANASAQADTDGDENLDNECSELAVNNELFAKMAQRMAVVDMGEHYIRKIIPHSWALSKLATQDSGEIPTLHVYDIDPAVHSSTMSKAEKGGAGIGDASVAADEPQEDDQDINSAEYVHSPGKAEGPKIEPSNKASLAVKCSYLALVQRKLEFVPNSFLHPFQLVVFGSPLLLRVRDLEGYTGKDLYDLIAQRMLRFVSGVTKERLIKECTVPAYDDLRENRQSGFETEKRSPTARQARRGRHHRQKTTADMVDVSAGEIPKYGFRLRLVSRDGSQCALCPWFCCCVGCIVPYDDYPTIGMCGDSISIDWHSSSDLGWGGFGWKINPTERSTGVQTSPHTRALMKMKRHSSCDLRGKKYGYSGSITLEECLDSFAKEERIPEAYCSGCKEFRVQTKRMSLWRLPPLVIIQLKRFQFTPHMKRKLRDLVVFPVEDLDLSRIVAPSTLGSNTNGNSNTNQARTTTTDAHSKDIDDSAGQEHIFGGSFHPLSRHNCGRSESNYDLYGVVHHQGALSGGHYVASLKSELDGKWRLFNDAQVYELLSRDVVDASAYILFYMRKDVKGAKLEDFWDTEDREGKGLTEEEVEKLMKQRDRCAIS